MQPLISVIVPVYNKEKYITSLISDMKAQVFQAFECIFIDDGSTDKSGKLCDELIGNDEHFVVLHLMNQGVSHARNVALDIAKGQFITFIDADDRIPKNYLECLYKDISMNKSDISICLMTKVWKSGRKQQIQLPRIGKNNFVDLLPYFAECQRCTGIYGYCCGKLIRRSVIAEKRFDQQICLAEDFLFYLKIYSSVKRISFTNETEYYYLQETENSSALLDDNAIDYNAQLSINIEYKHFLEKMGVYTGDNSVIVSQLLSKYLFYVLFYCKISELKSSYKKMQQVYKKEKIDLYGRNAWEKWILLLFRYQCYWLLKESLRGYRFLRKIIRRV